MILVTKIWRQLTLFGDIFNLTFQLFLILSQNLPSQNLNPFILNFSFGKTQNLSTIPSPNVLQKYFQQLKFRWTLHHNGQLYHVSVSLFSSVQPQSFKLFCQLVANRFSILVIFIQCKILCQKRDRIQDGLLQFTCLYLSRMKNPKNLFK